MNPVKVETNPRWEKAPVEQTFLTHPKAGIVTPAPALRYETHEDLYSSRAIPPYLTTFEDGHTEETW